MTTATDPVSPPQPACAVTANEPRRTLVYVRFEATQVGLDRLIERGWLKPEDRRDLAAVTEAFLRLGA